MADEKMPGCSRIDYSALISCCIRRSSAAILRSSLTCLNIPMMLANRLEIKRHAEELLKLRSRPGFAVMQ